MSQARPLERGFKITLDDSEPQNHKTLPAKFPRRMRIEGQPFVLATIVGTYQLAGVNHALTLVFTEEGIFSLDDYTFMGPVVSNKFLINAKLVTYIKVSLLCIFLV